MAWGQGEGHVQRPGRKEGASLSWRGSRPVWPEESDLACRRPGGLSLGKALPLVPLPPPSGAVVQEGTHAVASLPGFPQALPAPAVTYVTASCLWLLLYEVGIIIAPGWQSVARRAATCVVLTPLTPCEHSDAGCSHCSVWSGSSPLPSGEGLLC